MLCRVTRPGESGLLAVLYDRNHRECHLHAQLARKHHSRPELVDQLAGREGTEGVRKFAAGSG